MYDRQINDTTLTLIVSGRLWRNSLIMLDEETETYWSHITGEAMMGALAGKKLGILPSVQTTWKEWVGQYPDTKVLKKDKEILSSRYEDYFKDQDRIGIFGTHHAIKRLPSKELVHGIAIGPHSLAIVDGSIKAGEFRPYDIGGHPILITRGLDDGVRVFHTLVDGTSLHFVHGANPGDLVDRGTNSVWDMETGRCSTGAFKERQLEPVNVTTAFWFAWSIFYTKTEILQ